MAPSYHVDLSGMYVPCYSCVIKKDKSMNWGRKPWDGPLAGKMGINGMGGGTKDCHQQAEDSQCPCLKYPATKLSSGLTLTPVATNISGVQCPMTFNVSCSDSSLFVMV